MKKSKLTSMIGVLLGTFQFNDVAFGYRMGAGFPGRVNKTHPFEIDAVLTDAAAGTPMTAYGQAAILDSTNNAVRPAVAGDHSDATPILAYGITVSPFPMQQSSTSAQFGATQNAAGAISVIAPPTVGPIDVLRLGAIMINIAPSGATATKGGAVYVWCTATTGTPGTSGYHVQGGFESAFSSGNTVQIKNAQFVGPGDSQGNFEIYITPGSLL